MKFALTLHGSNLHNGVQIEAGESIEMPLSFYNTDGSARNMSGAVLTAKVFNDDDMVEIADIATITDNVLIIAGASTANLLGAYVVRIIETRGSDTPPTVNMASFRLLVRNASFL